MRKGWWTAALLAMAASSVEFACGGEATTSGSADGPIGTCSGVCETISARGCPNEASAQCTTTCEEGFAASTTACPRETSRYLGCIQTQAVFECNADGEAVVDGPTLYRVCPKEVAAYLACSACLPLPTDRECDTCIKTRCCGEQTAFVSHPDLVPFAECLEGCASTTATCETDCLDRFPSYRQAAEAQVDCQLANCSTC